MRPLFVVNSSPALDLPTRVFEIEEQLFVHALAPEARVKTFDVRVLNWFTRFDKFYLDVTPHCPVHKFSRRHFWSVVATKL